MNQENNTPRELGYHMPAEWESHEATWLSWPHKEESWPGAFESVPGIFAELTRHLAESELVRINVADADFAERVNGLLRAGGVNLDAVRFHFNPTNDASPPASANARSTTGDITHGAINIHLTIWTT
jgi:agmatine deiminase